MTAAMMLPTTLPLVGIFRRLVAGNPDRGLLLALLLAGYLAAWLVFGITAHGMGAILAGLVSRSPWLSFNGWLLGAAIFLIAGLFQFSGLKRRCLDACRTPLHFVLGRWRGLRPRLESLRLGWAHGVYCVGCCWALMLLMFVVGTGSIGWMLGLGAVMALEKNSPSGQTLGTPLGSADFGLGGHRRRPRRTHAALGQGALERRSDGTFPFTMVGVLPSSPVKPWFS